MNNSKNKPLQEVEGGKHDNYGFYYTPEGSFWDPDGISFDKDGYDCHGGYYAENLEYCPGAGWIDDLMCYEDEKEEVLKKMGININDYNNSNSNADEFEEEGEDGELDNIYDDIDYEKLLESAYAKFGIVEKNDVDNLNLEKEKKFVYIPGKTEININLNNKNRNQMGNNNAVFNKIKEENEISFDNDDSDPEIFDYDDNNKNSKSNKDPVIKKEEIVITSDMLFNKIPENMKPKEVKDRENFNNKEKEMTKTETKIDIDDLFG